MSSLDPAPGPSLWSNLSLWPGKRRRMFEDDTKDDKSEDDDVYVDVETVEGDAVEVDDVGGTNKEQVRAMIYIIYMIHGFLAICSRLK